MAECQESFSEEEAFRSSSFSCIPGGLGAEFRMAPIWGPANGERGGNRCRGRGSRGLQKEASSSFPLGCSPFEACIMLERDSGQKKPLEMNGAQTGLHSGVIDTGACRCNETDAGFSAPVIY